MNQHLFQGTSKIMYILYRQHRVKMIIWILGLVGIPLLSAVSYSEIYVNPEDIYGFMATMGNPAMIAMLGPAYDMNGANIGTVFATELLLFTMIAVVVMNILLASSCTRDDEEEGRLELIQSLPTGRVAYITGAGILILIVNMLITLLSGIGLALIGENSMSIEASFLYGSLIGSIGLFFAALTILFAQLANTSRGANGLSFGALIIFYLLRAIGDVKNEYLSYLSPLGWATRSSVFYKNIWWPVGALLLGTVLLVMVSMHFNKNRDINSGILPNKSGRNYAPAYLKSPVGLAWKLERINLIVWIICIFLMSAAFGAILGDMETYFSDMEILKAFFNNDTNVSMIQQYINLLIGILSIFSGIPAVTTILKLKKEERLGYIQNLYVQGTSRGRIIGSYAILAVISTCIMQLSIGLGLYVSSSISLESSISFSDTLASAMVYLPSLWFLVGIALLLVGLYPKATGFVWAYIVFDFLVLYLADLLSLPQWIVSLSVFHHIPQLSIESMNWMSVIGISLGSILLTIIGYIGYYKRDMM